MNNQRHKFGWAVGYYGPIYVDEDESVSDIPFTMGIGARKAGKDATTANPFLSRKFRQEWMAGWADEDMAQFTESYDYKNKDGK